MDEFINSETTIINTPELVPLLQLLPTPLQSNSDQYLYEGRTMS